MSVSSLLKKTCLLDNASNSFATPAPRTSINAPLQQPSGQPRCLVCTHREAALARRDVRAGGGGAGVAALLLCSA